ncbi:MAG: trigger factor [Candidatus Pacebacteria bacterium]|nr:trigger factor [Candidatus Paceibacterota bacterium]
MSSSHKIVATKALPDSEVEIKVEIEASKLADHRLEAVKNLGTRVKLDGFRQGHIPEKILVDRLGEMTILEEAAELALKEVYGSIMAEAKISETKIHPIGSPKVTITKIAAGNPLEVTITTAIVPSVVLPDYKKIAGEVMAPKNETAKEEEIEVSDKEVDDAIEDLRKRVAHSDFHAKQEKEKPAETKSDDHDHNHGDLPLPELNEDFIKKFGDFATIEAFKKTIRENILKEKEYKAKDKKRVTTIEKIIADMKVTLPKILVESELTRMISQFKSNIKDMGMDPEAYLVHSKKTEADLRTEWKSEAEKRAKIQLAMNQIALEEKIQASEEEIKKETELLLSSYKDADPLNASIYVETVLTNEKVWEFLEKQNM